MSEELWFPEDGTSAVVVSIDGKSQPIRNQEDSMSEQERIIAAGEVALARYVGGRPFCIAHMHEPPICITCCYADNGHCDCQCHRCCDGSRACDDRCCPLWQQTST